MMNRDFAINFARASAKQAYEQKNSYMAPVITFRDNMVEVLGKQGALQYKNEALAIYDKMVKDLFGHLLAEYSKQAV